MQARLEAQKVSPAAYQAMLGLEKFVKQSKLEPALLELVVNQAGNACLPSDFGATQCRTVLDPESRALPEA